MIGEHCLAEVAEPRPGAADTSVPFNLITSIVAKTLGCGASFITIIDKDTQWVAGAAGPDSALVPSIMSIYSVCAVSQSPLLIADASLDTRFAHHALVKGPPALRSYLGVPLCTAEGVAIGSLCAISSSPNAFSAADLDILSLFAALIENKAACYVPNRQVQIGKAGFEELGLLISGTEKTALIGSWRIELFANQVRLSKQSYTICGLPDEVDISFDDAISFFAQEDRAAVRRALSAARRHGRSFQIEVSILRPEGTIRRVRMSGERLEVEGRSHAIAGVILDCTDEYQKALALSNASERDKLTKLLDRPSLEKRLRAMFEADRGSTVTVALFNLDGFKYVNDALGHVVGDQLLSLTGERLSEHCYDEIFVARWGDDEFSLLFPANTSLEDAAGLCEQLVAMLSKDVVLADGEFSVSVTCGLAQVDQTNSPADLMRRADLALYHGKENGRGSVHCWNEYLESASSTRQRAINMLKSAFADGRAFAVYQPIVELENGNVVGVEALLRLKDGLGRIIAASDFFSAITDPVMSRRISQFMIEQILTDGPQLLQKFGAACQIGFNVSEADLRATDSHEDFVGLLTRLTLQSSLRPQNIVLEITETMLLRDEDGYIRDGLRALDRLGYSIALDDFGTGYSSLTHLRDFPIAKVKIDKEFVSAISSDHQSRMIIQAIVQMSRSLGLEVVAEGVENASEEVFLRAVGCRYVQGFRYGKPMPISSADFEQETSQSTPTRRTSSAR